jgi:hypothetical protein
VPLLPYITGFLKHVKFSDNDMSLHIGHPWMWSSEAENIKKEESNCQTKKIKIWSRAPRPTSCWLQYNMNFRDCTANYRPVLSSERAPYMKKKEIVTQRTVKSGHLLQSGAQHQDEPADWPSVAI